MKPGIALLVSIRPRFVEQIFAGTKTVELRRVRPRVTRGDLVIIYASGAQGALVGAFQVANLIAAAPSTVWRRFGSQKTGLSKVEYDRYFAGVDTAYGLEVAQTWQLPVPVPLATLRRKRGGFHAPQSFRYLDLNEVVSLGGDALLGGSNRRKG